MHARYGAGGGITSGGDEVRDRDEPGIADGAGAGDAFGAAFPT